MPQPGSPPRHYVRSDVRTHAPARVRVAATVAAVVLVHALGFGLLGLARLTAGDALTLGVALSAYGLGARHALDADHIAGIDNAIRKFVAEGRRPVGVGLAFSLGHSSVVLLATSAVVAGIGSTTGLLAGEGATATALGTFGAAVAGGFLLLVAGVNAVALRGTLAARRCGTDEVHSSAAARVLSAPLRRVRHPRHVYVLGFLFGLGFDTASSVGLIALAVTASLSGAATWLVLCLPLCFAAGMTAVDGVNGIAMVRMYGSAQIPSRDRQMFNVVVTAVSVVAAGVLGAIITLSAVDELLPGYQPVASWAAGVDLAHAGWWLAAGFAAIWVAAAVTLWARRGSAVVSGPRRTLRDIP
ncbi:nickel transporter [Rhodococcus ruber]|uniref:Nickel/cobalt efflux system n=1 Tax=Rhodococcus ruber TaxID=1830 RepID=A0A098BGD9_9NOCA|nr:nickel transporter [Rhodococcus ruber]MBD8053781.1 nickel transporter [Rhodococcus ruber]MCD2129083.1 nickel transporter [Rhodococcus ruber]MCZ4504755.1 nickel transporter [Rhodococcus ruber]MCZ4532310.1 nickel transporter [Rhodococcus ruber]MCZ4622843.1 nickel transporter [Rhodococcus ruber]